MTNADATWPRVGCGAAIIRDGKLLLVRRRRDPEARCWGLPGGKVDAFEPLAESTALMAPDVLSDLGWFDLDVLPTPLTEADEAGDEHAEAPVAHSNSNLS